jgi:hypothetical protein
MEKATPIFWPRPPLLVALADSVNVITNYIVALPLPTNKQLTMVGVLFIFLKSPI